MVKEFSSAGCGIRAEYTHDFTYTGALYGLCGVSRLEITNRSGRDWNRTTVAVTGGFFSPRVKIYSGIASGATAVIEPESLCPDLGWLYHIGYDFATEIRITVSGDDETFDAACLPVKIYTRRHFSGELQRYEMLASFVDPDCDIVKEITENAADGNDDYASDFTRLRLYVESLYNKIKDLGISYRDVFFRADKGQDIVTASEIGEALEGNSLDLALLLCSCLERGGVRSSLIYFNASVIVGAWVAGSPAADAAVTGSAEKIYELISSDHPVLVLVDPAGVATGKEFADASYSACRLLLDEDPRYFIDIEAARSAGIRTMVPADRPESAENEDGIARRGDADVFGILKKNAGSVSDASEPAMLYRHDSTQIAALAAADSGCSVVIDAPVGAGRTRTMASLIANALCKDRRVLCFVDDDMVASELMECLGAVGSHRESDDGDFDRLTAMHEAMHGAVSDGLSLYDVIEKYYQIGGAAYDVDRALARNMNADEAGEVAEILRSFDDIEKSLGRHPSRFPLVGIYPRVKTSRGQERIEAFLEEFPRFLKRSRRRERSVLNKWIHHRDAMQYLEGIEQWNTFRRLVVLDEKLLCDIDTIAAAIDRWYRSRELFADWAEFAGEVAQLNRLGALDVLDFYLEGHSGKATADAFLKGYYLARAKNTVSASECLRTFDHAACISNVTACGNELDNIVASWRDDLNRKGLKNLSVTTSVENIEGYDLAVVVCGGGMTDEKLSCVAGAVGSIVVVGDSRCGVSDSVFNRVIESGLPKYDLGYMSEVRHESIAAFRNRLFYASRLTTFPSADDRCRGIIFTDPEGVFDPETQTNVVEADAVVSMLRDVFMSGDIAVGSVGVIVLCPSQCDLIAAAWDEMLKTDGVLSRRVKESGVRVFIKRLRDLNGSERCDTLIIATGYAPDPDGNVTLGIDGISGRDGERLLNRALACASQKLVVVSSLRPAHIPNDEALPYGVRVLRSFYAYAMDRSRLDSGDGEVSAVVTSISDALAARGYDTDMNVGHSGWRLDIAVKDRNDKSRYMRGIIVDGRNYASLPVAVDRDIVVPEIMSSLGWDIRRVWTVEWFNDPESVIDRILRE